MICRSVVNLVILLAELSLAHYPEYQYPNNEAGEYPSGYGPDERDEERTFDGIYDRRKNFEVEKPMGFPTEASSEADQQIYDQPTRSGGGPDSDHYHHHDVQSSDPNQSPADDYLADAPNTDPNAKSLLSDGCLRCLCEASSDCDPQVRCHVEGPNDYHCGPFQVNANYWSAAGSPGADQNDPMDFEECMNDIECSIDTVNGYMSKNAKDCDGDGRVTCDDYAKVHKAGANNCNSSWIVGTPFWNKYKDCYFEYR